MGEMTDRASPRAHLRTLLRVHRDYCRPRVFDMPSRRKGDLKLKIGMIEPSFFGEPVARIITKDHAVDASQMVVSIDLHAGIGQTQRVDPLLG